jgi:hypothetical protein
MRASCSAGVSPSGSDADPRAQLPLEAGHPDHEEFIKLLAEMERNRTRSRADAPRFRFLEHAAIELQPGQLTIDEALGLDESSKRGNGRAGSGSVSGVISSSLTVAWLISAMAGIL